MVYIETERLLLRDWKEQDLVEFREMNKDSRVMKFFPKTLTDDETDSFYSRIEEEFKNYGYGLYAVETKQDNSFIGFTGFHWATFNSQFTPCIEIGWRLKFDAWGNGYATEGAKACLKYGFETLKLTDIYSFTSKINLQSENVMKKIGMTKAMEFEHPNIVEGSPLRRHVLYVVNK
ncbi:MAG: GNAT family N-acetyltransferase [Bacillota bacterium]|nr:GNAT family N-acetyltransferase [Bacillota bacterium]